MDDERDDVEDTVVYEDDFQDGPQVVQTPSGVEVWLVKHTGQQFNEQLKQMITVDVPGQWQVMIQTRGRVEAKMSPTRWAFVCDHNGAPVNRDTNIQLPPQFDAEIYDAVKQLMPSVGRLCQSSMPVHMRDGEPVEL